MIDKRIPLSGLFLICIALVVTQVWRQEPLAARDVLTFCRNTSGAAPHPTDAFLAAVVLDCEGDEESAVVGWRRYLADSAERLSVVRAFRPNDVALAQLAATTYPDNSLAYVWLGESLTASGEAVAAANALERAIVLQGGTDAEQWLKLGVAYENAAELPSAARAFDEACRLFDRGGNGCVRAGHVYLELADYPTALDRYEQSTAQLAQYGVFYGPTAFGMAQALIALDRADEALPYLERLAGEGHGQAAQLLEQLQSTP